MDLTKGILKGCTEGTSKMISDLRSKIQEKMVCKNKKRET